MTIFSKTLRMLAAVCLLLPACAGTVNDEEGHEDLGEQASELKNGMTFDGSPFWNGVVKVELLHEASNTWITCSGQIVSGRTILTAAHCFHLAGVFDNPVSMFVRVSRPTFAGSGWLTVLPITWAYVKHNPDFINANVKHDVGLVIVPNSTSFSNVQSWDAIALSKTAPNNLEMRAHGFGYYDNNLFDGLGRSGGLTPTYNAPLLEYNYSAAGTQPQLCRGDSGGPLKTTTLVYGVLSQLSGFINGKCGSSARWATAKDNMTWLKNNIRSIGSCTETASQLKCW